MPTQRIFGQNTGMKRKAGRHRKRKEQDMEKIERDYYKALIKGGSAELAETGDSVEEMREIIDRVDERAAKLGYEPYWYIIVHVEHSKWFDDDGLFVKEEKFTRRVQIYPEKKRGGRA